MQSPFSCKPIPTWLLVRTALAEPLPGTAPE